MTMVQPPLGDPHLLGNRGSYHRPDAGEEWYLNGPTGIEQGFVLWNRPKGSSGMLTLELEVEGSLSPSLSADGEHVLLRDDQGIDRLRYSNLVAMDARGVILPSQMRVSHGFIGLTIDDHSARYPITIDPLSWRERRKIHASDAEVGAQFGSSVAISGDTAIVGAYAEDEGGSYSGPVYVFYRNEGRANEWGQMAKLKASDAQAYGSFGFSTAISGDTASVGAFDMHSGSTAGSAYLLMLDHLEGDACSSDVECHSGYCVDDVCCDAECSGPCMACISTLTGESDANAPSSTWGRIPKAIVLQAFRPVTGKERASCF